MHSINNISLYFRAFIFLLLLLTIGEYASSTRTFIITHTELELFFLSFSLPLSLHLFRDQ